MDSKVHAKNKDLNQGLNYFPASKTRNMNVYVNLTPRTAAKNFRCVVFLTAIQRELKPAFEVSTV